MAPYRARISNSNIAAILRYSRYDSGRLAPQSRAARLLLLIDRQRHAETSFRRVLSSIFAEAAVQGSPLRALVVEPGTVRLHGQWQADVGLRRTVYLCYRGALIVCICVPDFFLFATTRLPHHGTYCVHAQALTPQSP